MTRPTDALMLESYRLHGLTQALEILTSGQELGEDLIKSNAAHCLIDRIAKLSEQVTELVDQLDRQLRGAGEAQHS